MKKTPSPKEKFYNEIGWTILSATEWLTSGMSKATRSFKFNGKWYTVTVTKGKHHE